MIISLWKEYPHQVDSTLTKDEAIAMTAWLPVEECEAEDGVSGDDGNHWDANMMGWCAREVADRIPITEKRARAAMRSLQDKGFLRMAEFWHEEIGSPVPKRGYFATTNRGDEYLEEARIHQKATEGW